MYKSKVDSSIQSSSSQFNPNNIQQPQNSSHQGRKWNSVNTQSEVSNFVTQKLLSSSNDHEKKEDLFTNPLHINQITIPEKFTIEDKIERKDNITGQVIVKQLLKAIQSSQGRLDFTGTKLLSGIWYPQANVHHDQLDNLDTKERAKWFYVGRSEGFLPKEFFDHQNRYGWSLKKDCRASEALRAIFSEPCILECVSVCHVYYYKVLLEVLGDAKFDQLFGDENNGALLGPLFIGFDGPKYSNLYKFLQFIDLSSFEGKHPIPLEYGDWCYFQGVEEYNDKHRWGGVGKGINISYLGKDQNGEQLFGGLGFNGPVTKDEVHQELLYIYNLPPTPPLYNLNASPEVINGLITVQSKPKVKGFDYKNVIRLDQDLLNKLKDAPYPLKREYVDTLPFHLHKY